MVNVLVFGASIVWGAWDLEGGWVQRLRKHIDKIAFEDDEFDCKVYNLGVSGDTSEDLLKRFEFETQYRNLYDKGIIFIISIGVNDSIFLNAKNARRVQPEQFRDNLLRLFDIAKKYSSQIIFLGLNPVDDAKLDPIPWAPEMTYKNEFVKEFDGIAKDVCKESNVHFIDIFERFMEKDYKELLDDGIHPNSEGHRMISKIVKAFLFENEIITAEKVK